MQPQLEAGQILANKFQIEKVLGQGGMGVVVAARHLQLEQKVALKFLLPEAAQHGDTVQRFLREARAAVKLRSEHVAKVLDVGTLDTGSPYIVMEFLQGDDLSTHLERQGPLPVEEAIDYVMQACEGLADAHKAGIIHRDLKPANLFLTTRSDGSPCVKILDFGISKLNEGIEKGITKTTEIMGSPQYMSPEQLRAARLTDARSDIWALGVILFQLLTGQMPFERETLPELFTAIVLDTPPSPRSLRGDLPEGLALIMLRCLEKDPAHRYQSVAELAAALAPFGPGHASASADRVSRILGPSPVSLSAPVPSAAPRTTEAAQTSVDPVIHGIPGPTTPEGAAPPRKNTPLLLGLGALLAVGAAGFFLTREPPAKTPETTATSAPTLPAAPSASPPPSAATAASVALPVVSAVPSASAAASASSPPAAPVRPPPASTKTTPPAVKPPTKPPTKGATDFGDRR